MRSACLAVTAAVAVTAAASAGVILSSSLSDVCTSTYVQASLPDSDFYPAIEINSDSVVVNAVTNASVSDQDLFPDATFDYCNVTFSYSHAGRSDNVNVWYWFPSPDKFQNRYLSTGGGGYALSSGDTSLPGGVIYGASAGSTDGGFGGFDIEFDATFPLVNGTANYETLYMFGYQAIHELSIIGKQLTKNFFAMNSTKLYSYYQGCSEGGRDGWGQLQRYADEWDGAVTGAPAFRYSFQQVQHLYSNVVEQTLGYYPPTCELEKIVNETIAFCDPLDGKTDGVVARSDLCKLQFNINSTIGQAYYCAASSGSSSTTSAATATPEQNGTVSAQGVAVASKIIDGLHTTSGQRAYLSYQPAASFSDATTAYDNTTDTWGLSINSIGIEFVLRFIELVNASSNATLDDVTYDTLRDWIFEAWQIYEDSLQTNWPDLTPLESAGGKVIHFHGEADDSIPTASSVRYYESVRQIMYPGLSFNDSTTALKDWYRLFLVPGAGHCAPNAAMPNGPFPQTTLAVLIDWVEKGVVPTTLNATVLQGDFKGQNQQICAWPERPLWSGNGTEMECVYDQASINTWLYDFDAFKMPVY